MIERPAPDPKGPLMPGPLEGLKIIEIAGIGPGPFCAMMLADMGAEVIRVERAQNVRGGDPASPPADVLMRGRRSIGVDLKNPDGVETVLSLVEEVHRTVDIDEAKKLAKKVKSGKGFDLEDYKQQVSQMRKMGGLSAMLDKLPAELAKAAQGAQVLDLEGLAGHRGSVLGALPGAGQPSQKRFDTLCWQALRGFDPARPVFVESESRRIGALRVPEALIGQLREHGQCIHVELDAQARLRLLLQDYGHFAADAEGFSANRLTGNTSGWVGRGTRAGSIQP